MGCTHEMDLQEVDSAQYTGVDNVRDIRMSANLMPMGGKMRAWIMDECHRMSPQAQDALLKLLEDTPKRSMFLLATTDPGKLLPTVRSRCVQFQVESPEEDVLAKHLRDVSRREKVRLSGELAEQIARDSLGSVRDAMMILEQVIRLPEEKREEAARRMAEKTVQTVELCRALMSPKTKWASVAKILEGLKNEDAEGVRRAVIGYCAAILRKRDNPQAFLVGDTMLSAGIIGNGWPGMTLICYRAVMEVSV